MNREALIAELRARLPNLLAVYLFGSRASGVYGPDSDLDLAILNDGPLDPLALWDLSSSLAEIAGCAVDLVDLRAASTVLQYQVITKGLPVWALNAQAGIYEAFILSEKTALDNRRAGLLADIVKDGHVYGR
jgi:predicted nucleotidyltransferase